MGGWENGNRDEDDVAAVAGSARTNHVEAGMREDRRTWVYVALVGGGVVAVTAVETMRVSDRGGGVGAPLEMGMVRLDLVAVEIALLVTLLTAGYLRHRSQRKGGSEPETPRMTDSSEDSDELTDPEHVYRLVADNGGSMRQADIVRHFAWSKAKISRLVSELEQEGEIRKVQLGRENRIYVDGCEPAACRTPFEQPGDEHEY